MIMPVLSEKEITRRSFIAKVGGGIVEASVSGALLKDANAQQLVVPDPPGRKLGWAVVGLGNLSIHEILPAFAKCEKSKVVAFVSGHPDKANKLAMRYGVNPKNIYNYQNYDTIKDNPEIDIIYIVLPNGMHAEYTVRGLQAGKHVLTEKPMANTPAECQQMIDAGRKANKKLMVAYRCRYEPYNQEAIRVARSHELGTVKVILADAGFAMKDPNVWRLKKSLAGGGSLMDIGIYALQAARYLTGEEPIVVSAMETRTDPVKVKEVDESIVWQLKFPGGVLAYCSTTYLVNGLNRYTAYAEKGWFGLEPAYSYAGMRGRRSD